MITAEFLASLCEPLVFAPETEKVKGISAAIEQLEIELLKAGASKSAAFSKSYVFGDLLHDHITALENERGPKCSH